MAMCLKRVYDSPEEADGFEIPADNRWPGGLKKKAANIDVWLKDIV